MSRLQVRAEGALLPWLEINSQTLGLWGWVHQCYCWKWWIKRKVMGEGWGMRDEGWGIWTLKRSFTLAIWAHATNTDSEVQCSFVKFACLFNGHTKYKFTIQKKIYQYVGLLAQLRGYCMLVNLKDDILKTIPNCHNITIQSMSIRKQISTSIHFDTQGYKLAVAR